MIFINVLNNFGFKFSLWAVAFIFGMGIVIMDFILLGLLSALILFCIITGVVFRKREQLKKEEKVIDANLDKAKEMQPFGTSGLMTSSSETMMATSTFSDELEFNRLQNKYNLLKKMYIRLLNFTKLNNVVIPSEFEDLVPVNGVLIEKYPFAKPELVSVSSKQKQDDYETVPLTLPQVELEEITEQTEQPEEAIEKVEEKVEVIEANLADNEYLLKCVNTRVVFPNTLIEKLKLKDGEKIWTIIHNKALKLGVGEIPYKNYESGRSYKVDAAGQIKVGEKVFVELGLNICSLKAKIVRGVITVMET